MPGPGAELTCQSTLNWQNRSRLAGSKLL